MACKEVKAARIIAIDVNEQKFAKGTFFVLRHKCFTLNVK